MIAIQKNNLFGLLGLLFRQAFFRVLGALAFKLYFILFQVASVWVIISWLNGSVIDVVQQLVGQDVTSFIYPLLASASLILAALCGFAARALGISSIKKVEVYVSKEVVAGNLLASDYRNMCKLLLALIEALVPALFIISVAFSWVFFYPILLVPIISLVALVLFVFVKGVRLSEGNFSTNGKRTKPEDYIGSDEYKRFYRVLMVPQYFSIIIYILMSVGILGVAYSIRNFSFDEFDLSILPIVSALALLQLKSFIGLLVRFGAYYRNAKKALLLMKKS